MIILFEINFNFFSKSFRLKNKWKIKAEIAIPDANINAIAPVTIL